MGNDNAEGANPLELMAEWLRDRFPEARVQMTEGLKKSDSWHLDLEQGDRLVSVEWMPGTLLFTVSDNSVGSAGAFVEETYRKMKDAYSQVLDLFLRPLK